MLMYTMVYLMGTVGNKCLHTFEFALVVYMDFYID
jgi:hypothetical protein